MAITGVNGALESASDTSPGHLPDSWGTAAPVRHWVAAAHQHIYQISEVRLLQCGTEWQQFTSTFTRCLRYGCSSTAPSGSSSPAHLPDIWGTAALVRHWVAAVHQGIYQIAEVRLLQCGTEWQQFTSTFTRYLRYGCSSAALSGSSSPAHLPDIWGTAAPVRHWMAAVHQHIYQISEVRQLQYSTEW